MEYSFERLEVWKRSRVLVKDVYGLTKGFPLDERYGLTNQIRRAIISVSSNIAEGSTRQTEKEKGRFYEIAYGSLVEVLNQLIIANDLDYLDHNVLNAVRPEIEETGRMLNGLYQSTRRKVDGLRSGDVEKFRGS
ncbi:MAG: four helix bundle protein [Marinilabiliaceae bacterium]|nr:four helix bundle protein [Marinilabiliaceae bacterium]